MSTPDRLPPPAGDDEEASLVYEPTVLSYDAVGDVGEGGGREGRKGGREDGRTERRGVGKRGWKGGRKLVKKSGKDQ